MSDNGAPAGDVDATRVEPVGPGHEVEIGVLQEGFPNLLPLIEDPEDLLLGDAEMLADLRLESGVQITFSYDPALGEYGVNQSGFVGESGPMTVGQSDTVLGLFLAATPKRVPIPRRLAGEPDLPSELAERIATRDVTDDSVVVDELDWPIAQAGGVVRSGSCWDETLTMPKTFYSAHYGGARRFCISSVINELPTGYPSYLWVRHRIYYKQFNHYNKHYEKKVGPGQWDLEVKKGSIKRHRRAIYDIAWVQQPANPWVPGGLFGYSCSGCFIN